jgi:hypothetical protein
MASVDGTRTKDWSDNPTGVAEVEPKKGFAGKGSHITCIFLFLSSQYADAAAA